MQIEFMSSCLCRLVYKSTGEQTEVPKEVSIMTELPRSVIYNVNGVVTGTPPKFLSTGQVYVVGDFNYEPDSISVRFGDGTSLIISIH